MTATPHKLYNRSDLAKALGVKHSFIRRLIRHGFKMPMDVSTPARVHAFLAGLENDQAMASADEKTTPKETTL